MDKTLFDSMIRDIYQNRKPDGIKSDFGKVQALSSLGLYR